MEAPAFPSSADAAADAGRPAETSAGVSFRIDGSPVSATAARPSVVANEKGMANLSIGQSDICTKSLATHHARPPSRYAFTVLAGLLAMARCQ
jgi:hypothetical protein